MNKQLVLALILCTTPALGKQSWHSFNPNWDRWPTWHITQGDSFATVLSGIRDKNTLVVVDIDDTLITPDGTLTERSVLHTLQTLKERGHKIIACTARPWKSREFTVKQLNDLGISFVDTAITQEVMTFNTHKNFPREAAGYADGIIYCGWNPKGKMLAMHLLDTEYQPSSVVFIDDHKPFVESVDQYMRRMKIPSVCIHYVPRLQSTRNSLFPSVPKTGDSIGI